MSWEVSVRISSAGRSVGQQSQQTRRRLRSRRPATFAVLVYKGVINHKQLPLSTHLGQGFPSLLTAVAAVAVGPHSLTWVGVLALLGCLHSRL